MAEGKQPTRKRGHHTRARLLSAAVRVFEADGFVDARIADIAAIAGVSHGTFYTYFDSKEDVLRTITDPVIAEMSEEPDLPAEASAALRLVEEDRHYFATYERHAAVLGLIEQLGTFTQFRELRAQLRDRLTARMEAAIRRLRSSGESEVERLDEQVAARALVGMLETSAYRWYVQREPFPRSALDDLDALILRALGVAPAAAAATVGSRRS